MSAAELARALRGHKAGAGWLALCPAHPDGTPSLSIHQGADGKVLVHCHAGCDQMLVLASLRGRGFLGRSQPTPPPIAASVPKPAARTQAALGLWHAAVELAGTRGDLYFRKRGIDATTCTALRFHRALRHPGGGSWPGIVALVTDVRGMPTGVHRTFLAADGFGKAGVQPSKMMLGPCAGCGVRLAEAADTVLVGEGIETCLSAMEVFGLPAWAALSAPGLQAIELPASIREVIVLADGDPPGERAACAAAARFKREHRRVSVARAPAGSDFNDVLFAQRKQRKE